MPAFVVAELCVAICVAINFDSDRSDEFEAACRGPAVALSQVEKRDGILVLVDGKVPFTGRVVEFSPVGAFSHSAFFNGIEEFWDVGGEAWPDQIVEGSAEAQALRDEIASSGHSPNSLLYIEQIADEEDVPALLAALQKAEAPPGKEGSPGKEAIARSCIEVLEKIAGGPHGKTHAEWMKWWSSRQAARAKQPRHAEPGVGADSR